MTGGGRGRTLALGRRLPPFRHTLREILGVLTSILAVALFVPPAAAGSPVVASAPLAAAPGPTLGSAAVVPVENGSQGGFVPGAVFGPAYGQNMVYGAISFNGRNPAGQSALLEALYTPGSSLYHHFLTGNQWDTYFGPDPSTQASLLTYFQGYGLQVTQTSDLLWNIQGTAGATGSAFGTTFVSATYEGHTGYAPVSPLTLPRQYQSLVQIAGGFQSVDPLVPHVTFPHPASPAAVSLRGPSPQVTAATLTLTVTPSTWTCNFASTATPYACIPTNTNISYTLTITGGTAPYTVSWHWGDGTIQHVTATTGTLTLFHTYTSPAQSDYCDQYVCTNLTVYATDAAADNGSKVVPIFDAVSPTTDQLYYNAVTLYKLGVSGAGTKIGIDDLCDPDFSDYQGAIDGFDAALGVAPAKLDLVGTGAASCPKGSGEAGWSGETMLDIEWSHVIAPNATIVLDLAKATLDEGDATWNTLSNGVYVDSNSWGGPYTQSVWSDAAAQGQSYLTASGDCGSAGLTNAAPANNPNGVGVGGTDVYPFPSGIFRTEFAWNGSTDSSGCNNDEGSTGGCSSTFAAPAYQIGMTGFSCGTTKIGVPDVAAIGGTWSMLLYNCTAAMITAELCSSTTEPFWTISCGTSLASPTWAAMLDLMYDYNGTATQANGMADWDLFAIAKSANYDIGFHDVTVGNNIVSGSGSTAGTGWDPVTGLGSANLGQLAQLLALQNKNPDPYSALTVVEAANVTFGPIGLAVSLGADVAGGPSSLTGYSYTWNFGDCTTATTSVPYETHTYTEGGTYYPSVNVTGGSDTGASNLIRVHVAGAQTFPGCATPLTPGTLSGNRSLTGETSYALTFSASFTGGQSTFSGVFLWGDGSAKSTFSALVAGPATASHTFTSPGTYTVICYIDDSSSTTQNVSESVTVTVYAHVAASFTPSLWHPGAPANETFTAAVTGGDGADSLQWQFGDGASSGVSALLTASQIYYKANTYVVNLTVTDSLSYRALTSLTFTVFGASTAPLVLSTGWNLVALPLIDNDYTAYTLSAVVGAPFQALEDDRGAATTWYDRSKTADALNGSATIVGGDGVWVEVGSPETITIVGNATASLTASAPVGWSYLGWSVTGATTAAGLVALLAPGTVQAVSEWNAASQSYVTYYVGWDSPTGPYNFSISAGQAVYIWVFASGAVNE